jgi:hypothetical protein
MARRPRLAGHWLPQVAEKKEEQGNEKRKKNEPLALEKGSDKPHGAHSVGLSSVKGAVWQLAKQLSTPQLANQEFLLIVEHSGC